MPAQPATILLCGLEPSLAVELTEMLREHQVARTQVRDTGTLAQRLSLTRPDVVFCSSERGVFSSVMAALRETPRRVPVIAVSRTPEVSEWLDAIENGATDYCGAPFDTRSVSWILESSLRRAA